MDFVLKCSGWINKDLDYVKLKTKDKSIYYFAKDNLEFQRLEKQFNEKSNG